MQTSSGLLKTASQLSHSVRQHLNRYALAKVLIGVGLIVSAWPAEAKVVYTPVNVTISGNGSIKLDLNHDGITDFVLRSVSQVTVCGNRGGLIGSTKITPTIGNGVVVSHLNFAALLGSGIPIDASATFYDARTVVTQFLICSSGSQHVAGYLGLEFQINGQTHYGWAQVDVYASYNFRGHVMRTTLVAFAYETITGQAIKTGQTSVVGIGQCVVTDTNTLNGYCVGPRGGGCREAYDPTNCPPQTPVSNPQADQCAQSSFTVDPTRSCTP